MFNQLAPTLSAIRDDDLARNVLALLLAQSARCTIECGLSKLRHGAGLQPRQQASPLASGPSVCAKVILLIFYAFNFPAIVQYNPIIPNQEPLSFATACAPFTISKLLLQTSILWIVSSLVECLFVWSPPYWADTEAPATWIATRFVSDLVALYLGIVVVQASRLLGYGEPFWGDLRYAAVVAWLVLSQPLRRETGAVAMEKDGESGDEIS